MDVLSTTLSIGAANGLALAVVLACVGGNRDANRVLALLVALLALRLGPYILGFAGAYDAAPWLTFFPFDFSFAFGPLLWVYVTLLTTGKMPLRWRLHFTPVIIQLGYWIICFALPLGAKWAWYTGAHLQVIAPIGAAIGLLSASFYLYAAYQKSRLYRAWLDSAFANREEARLRALSLILVAFGVALFVAVAFALTSWFVAPLDYFDRFPLMVVFALLTYGLALLGWRNASILYPQATEVSVDAEPASQPAPRGNAYKVQAEAWRARLVEEKWWRDETLDLAGLAEKLGASPRTLSRTLSEGLGQSFRELLGRIRVEAVAAALDRNEPDTSILALAMDAGFSSKASFNRAFQAYLGVTPSVYRRRAEKNGLKIRQTDPSAGSEAI